MAYTSDRYEEEARQWDESGRSAPLQPDPYYVMKLSCWIHSAGAKHDGVSTCLNDYLAALRQVLERKNRDWIDDLFDGKEFCSFCGESWRAENCSLCTHCSTAYPPCCGEKRQLTVLSNGNPECSVCHQGEIVG